MKIKKNIAILTFSYFILSTQLQAMDISLTQPTTAHQNQTELADAIAKLIKNSADICEIQTQLTKGADAIGTLAFGSYLFFVAAEHGRADVCRLLIEKGLNIHKSPQAEEKAGGYTPLMASIFAGFSDIAIILIDKGVDVNATNGLGLTPLIIAEAKGLQDVCAKLHAKGGVFNAKFENCTPLILEARNGGMDHIMEVLFEKIRAEEAKEAYNNKILYKLIKKGAGIDEIQTAIAKGANINASDRNGTTPLIMAAERGCADICLVLIGKGADVNAINSSGTTALMAAAQKGHKDICMLLIKEGANVNVANKAGDTPASEALRLGFTDLYNTPLK